MVAELERICSGFDELTLEKLAHVHLHDAIEMLNEAVEHYNEQENITGPIRGWTLTSTSDRLAA